MFFLFILILLVFLLIYTIHSSKLGIEICNLNFNSEQNEKLNKEFKIEIYILLLNKIKILKKDLRKIKNIKRDIKLDRKEIDISFLKNRDLKIKYFEILKNINLEINEINLKINIGTEDTAITAILTGILSIILGNIIKKPKYQIIPIYENKNVLEINLDGIFYINLMQYIYKVVKKSLKKKVLLKINWENGL